MRAVSASISTSPRSPNHLSHFLFALKLRRIDYFTRCRPSYFNLDEDNEFGCTPCFCYGHAAVCSSASGYSRVNVESTFVRGTERWAAIAGGANTPVVYDALSQAVTVVAPDREPAYFVAPGEFD